MYAQSSYITVTFTNLMGIVKIDNIAQAVMLVNTTGTQQRCRYKIPLVQTKFVFKGIT